MLIGRMKKSVLLSLFAALFLILGACSNANDENTENTENAENTENTENTEDVENTEEMEDMEGMDHSNMDMSSSGEVPEGLKSAENPTYPVGSKAIIQDAHMEGMKGAEATIVGAYDTTVYTISYTPTTGGERVENHKWVIHEELIDAGDAPLEPDTEVKTEASHMEGMEGATVEIDSAEQTTVYMVDFTTTTDGEEVKNHKWVTESELSPAE
ncbi:YdhK family protein [Cytobacillus kochii]|uniref:YdhK family protein n=1 Tax=Cytobacillus kochii TaxID=859143 RepID=UPI0025A16194|nr:YdhK family protein [Cytobacillus kochii]MDM5205373.1 YdhK family protein [Cytobacillus kochii]